MDQRLLWPLPQPARLRPFGGRMIWVPVPGFPGVEVTENGDVRSWRWMKGIFRREPLILRKSMVRRYQRVSIDHKSVAVHYLVLLAFEGPRPEAGMDGCHE